MNDNVWPLPQIDKASSHMFSMFDNITHKTLEIAIPLLKHCIFQILLSKRQFFYTTMHRRIVSRLNSEQQNRLFHNLYCLTFGHALHKQAVCDLAFLLMERKESHIDTLKLRHEVLLSGMYTLEPSK